MTTISLTLLLIIASLTASLLGKDEKKKELIGAPSYERTD